MSDWFHDDEFDVPLPPRISEAIKQFYGESEVGQNFAQMLASFLAWRRSEVVLALTQDYVVAQARVDIHEAEHGCGCPYYDRGCQDEMHLAGGGHGLGTKNCPEASELRRLLPPEEQVVIG